MCRSHSHLHFPMLGLHRTAVNSCGFPGYSKECVAAAPGREHLLPGHSDTVWHLEDHRLHHLGATCGGMPLASRPNRLAGWKSCRGLSVFTIVEAVTYSHGSDDFYVFDCFRCCGWLLVKIFYCCWVVASGHIITGIT